MTHDARVLSAACFMLLALAASCDSGASISEETGRPLVVTTTSVLSDLVENIAGDMVDVHTLIPPGADPHTFELTPTGIERLREADLVVVVGLGFELPLADVLDAAAAQGVEVYGVGPEIGPIRLDPAAPTDEEHDDHAQEEGHDAHRELTHDPHFWLDPQRASKTVTLIGERIASLEGIDPGSLRAPTLSFVEEILTMETELAELFASIPSERRKLVTTHDALRYLAERYGIDIVATVLGHTTDAEPSAQQLAHTVDTVRSEDVRVIAVAETESRDPAEAVARETGATVVPLFIESIGGADGPASYIEMMRTNARRLVEAMG